MTVCPWKIILCQFNGYLFQLRNERWLWSFSSYNHKYSLVIGWNPPFILTHSFIHSFTCLGISDIYSFTHPKPGNLLLTATGLLYSNQVFVIHDRIWIAFYMFIIALGKRGANILFTLLWSERRDYLLLFLFQIIN